MPDPVPGWTSGTDGRDPEDAGALAWVLGRARRRRARLVGAGALGALTELCSLALAATAAWLIVRAAEQPSFADLAVAAVGVRAFALGKAVLRYAERLTSHDATLRLLADLRASVVERLTRLAPTGLPADRRGDVLARLVDDIDRLQDLFLRVMGPMVGAGVAAAVAVLGAVLLDPAAGLALGLAVLVLGVVAPVAAHRATRRSLAAAGAPRAELQASIVDLATNAEELVACGAAPERRATIERHALAVDAHERRRARTTAALAGLAAGGPGVAAAAVVAAIAAGSGATTGPTVGVLVLLSLAVAELLGPLAATGDALGQVEVAADRVHALVRAPDPVAEPAAPAARPTRTDVALRSAAVGWPGARPVAAGIELALPARGRAVLVGPSGSGKSTVAATLVRFLDPLEGRCEIGGADSRDLGGDQVRTLVTWCQQDPWFASSTLADNLRIARPSATDEELWGALAAVHLEVWARALPEGLSTWLEHDAGAMSGGERQRLALARALLGSQPTIVLDEPTAHLDEETARAVIGDLLAATGDRAVLVIAHDAPAGPLAEAPVHRLERTAAGPARWVDGATGG